MMNACLSVHPDRIISNAGAQTGDILFLTKPLGMGPISIAAKQHNLNEEELKQAGKQMAALNKAAAEAMTAVGIGAEGVHACTDVTGYGLVGHSRNIAEASKVTLVYHTKALPVFENAERLSAEKINTGAVKANEALFEGRVDIASTVGDGLRRICFDAETSGGLIIAVAPDAADLLEKELADKGAVGSARVGYVEPQSDRIVRFL